MYCAGCGQLVTDERTLCPQCGRPLVAVPPGRTSEGAEFYVFERSIRKLRQYWFLFACLNVALGVAGLIAVQTGLSPHLGPWEPWPHPPYLAWTYLGGSAWTLLILRVALAALASIGLRDRTEWARLVTVVAAMVAVTQFPVGLMLGAFTLVKVLGKRNGELFHKFEVHTS
jgi:hypothetical protein